MLSTRFSVSALTLGFLLAVPTTGLASHGVTLVNMSQRDPAIGNATLALGGAIVGTQVGFQVSSGSPTCGSSYDHRVQFEVVPAGQAFTGSVTFSSPWYQGFKPSCVVKAFPQQNYTPPTTNGSWSWRVREQTRSGSTVTSTGPWTDFGGNGTGSDFVSNQPPVAEANGPYSGTQGVAVALDGTGSTDPDGSISLYEWDCTSDGTYDISGTSATGLSCTYADDGAYTVTLRVTDDGGSQATDTAAVDILNLTPTAEANGPYTGTRGFPIAVSATGSSDPDGVLTLFEWDCENDGTYEQNAAAPTGSSCTYATVGSYTVGLRVTDDDGGQATDTATVTVGNDPPTADAGGPYSGDEGSAIALDGTGSFDVGGGSVVQWEWDCTDDGVYDITATSGTGSACTYTDNGTFTIRLRATDDDGATAEDTATATIANVDPTIASTTGPTSGDEGDPLSFTAVGADAGADDVAGLTYAWDWGDTGTGSGASTAYSWSDEGTYTVTLTVTDDDGGFVSTTFTVDIANVAPTITSTPTLTASEAVQWTYAPTADEPGADTLTWSISASAPAAMTIDSATGALAWTPTYADAVVGNASFVLTVDDGDTGTDSQSVTLTIDVLDTDGDGLPDGWELANNLDPNDSSDATGDPDADGMTNLDELAEGTDPNSYDGPDAPVLTEPIAGDEVVDNAPDLFWTNANDPQNETLTYDVEVYDDASLSNLVTSVTAVAEDASGTSTWKVDLQLNENATYYWRARASDAWVDGPWSTEESFLVNAINEEPEAPVLTSPIAGETTASLTPTLLWADGLDVDGDILSYDVEVYDDNDTLLTSTTLVAGDGTSAEWTVDVELTEDSTYWWSVRAVDEHGLAGDWSEDEAFFVNTDNAAPFGVSWIAPIDGASLGSVSEFVVTEGEDPEGSDLDYQFEVDIAASFDSGDFQEVVIGGTGTGTVTLDLAGEGILLPENTLIYARVRAIDDGGVTSSPEVISFFLRGTNEPPPVPVLISPEDASSVESSTNFQVEVFEDPEGDVVFVDYVVARDAELTDVVLAEEGLIAPVGVVEFTLSNLEGTYYWSARVVDSEGAASEWAGAWSFTAPTEEDPGDDDDDDDGGGDTGCDCGSSVAGDPASPAWALLLLLLPVIRRRR